MYIIGFRHHVFPQFIFLLAISAITLFSGIHGLLQKRPEHFFYDRQELEPIPDTTDVQTASEGPDLESSKTLMIKYSGSALTEVHAEKLKGELGELMNIKKVFTNENLSIDDVAELLSTNSKYISQVINEYHEQNFYNYINSYRIEEAKKIIRLPGNEKYSLQGIANMVGFASKSTFNKAFKKFTGITPSEYRDQSTVS
jgi:YesN/AraC family two-component response regulator